MPRRFPPVAPVAPTGDEFARPPVFSAGANEATTGPRDVARFLGPPSEVKQEILPYPNT
jgi:hypothetical protein